MSIPKPANHRSRPDVRPRRRRPGAHISLLAAVILIGGCGESSTPSDRDRSSSSALPSTGPGSGLPVATAAAATPQLPSNRNSRPDAARLGGVWEGSYLCAQGATGLRLTITVVSDRTVEAAFDFYPLPSNPTVPVGSFAMRGTLAGDQLSLLGERWITQPEGYVLVDLQATVPADGLAAMQGTVDGAGCSTFSVSRTQ